MEQDIGSYFNEKVNALFDEDRRKQELYSTLGSYQKDHDIISLISGLKKVLNQPNLIDLFDDIRTLIPIRHQLPYARCAPPPPPPSLAVVRLSRTLNENLGFAVRGGLEHGVGIFVSRVVPNTPAASQGLRVGDEIVRVNGFTISQAIHQEALNLIKSRAELVLKVRRLGMLPVKNDNEVGWHYVDTAGCKNVDDEEVENDMKLEEVKLFIYLPIGGVLGCSVSSGPAGLEGIFVNAVHRDSFAEAVGLEPGDQILSVNGTNFFNISHAEALVALKSSRKLHLLIRKKAACDLFAPPETKIDWQAHRPHDSELSPVIVHADANGNFNNEVPQAEIWADLHVRQVDLIEQAIRVIEEKELTKATITEEPSSIEVKAEVHPVHASPESKPLPSTHHHLATDSLATAETTTRQSSILTRERSDSTDTKTTETSIECNSVSATAAETSESLRKNSSSPRRGKIDEVFEEHVKTMDTPSLCKMRSKSEKTRTNTGRISPERARSHSVTMETSSHAMWKEIDRARAGRDGASRLQPQSLSYLSTKNQSFRIQKPVLLHPTRNSYEAESMGIAEEDEDVRSIFDETTFNANRMFTNEQIAGREVKLITVPKVSGIDLGLTVELNNRHPPHNGVVVAEIYKGGAIHKQGELHVGDEIIMVDGQLIQKFTAEAARKLIQISYISSLKRPIQLIIAKALPGTEPETEVLPWPDYEEELPVSDLDLYVCPEWGHEVSSNDIPVSFI